MRRYRHWSICLHVSAYSFLTREFRGPTDGRTCDSHQRNAGYFVGLLARDQRTKWLKSEPRPLSTLYVSFAYSLKVLVGCFLTTVGLSQGPSHRLRRTVEPAKIPERKAHRRRGTHAGCLFRIRLGGCSRSYAENDTRRRDYTVICAEHGGAQPPNTTDEVAFFVTSTHHISSTT